MLGIVAICALASTIGADARWLAALGRLIATRGHIPAGVPFASASSAHWPNAIALGELIFHWLETALGGRGLMLAQLAAVAIGWALLAHDALKGGARASATALVLGAAAIGALPSLAIARAQLFSLALFPAIVSILRDDARASSKRIWLCVPLLALWANLHGAALTGLGVTLIYLVFARLRKSAASTVALGVAACAAVCLTPAGIRTISYYHGVLTNVAAERGQGLWAPLSLSAPFDVVLVIVVLALAASAMHAWRRRPPLWEAFAMVALAGLTVQAARSGVWLVAFLVAPAARGIPSKHSRRSLTVAVGAVSAALLVISVLRGPLPNGARPATIERAITIARGTPILASDVVAEQIALAGGRVWISNPIDAFSKTDQSAYLDWLSGRGLPRRVLVAGVRVVVVSIGSPEAALMSHLAGFRLVESGQRTRLYLRSA